MSGKLERQTCHHCGHTWEPRVKKPKKCPQCQNPLWVSPRPKRKSAAPTPTVPSEAPAPTPPTTDTSPEDGPAAASGAEEVLEPIYTRVEVVEEESPVHRLQREAEERLRRLANGEV